MSLLAMMYVWLILSLALFDRSGSLDARCRWWDMVDAISLSPKTPARKGSSGEEGRSSMMGRGPPHHRLRLGEFILRRVYGVYL